MTVDPTATRSRSVRLRKLTSAAGHRALVFGCVIGLFTAACSAPASSTPASTTPPAASQILPTVLATPAPTARPTVAPTPSPSTTQLKALSVTQLSVDGMTLEAGFGAVWASSNHGLFELSTTGKSNAIVLAGHVLDVGLETNGVLALVGGSQSTLVEIDPATGKTARQWPLPFGATSLAVGPDAAYVSHGTHPATIDRIDLKTGVLQSLTVGAISGGLVGGRALATGDGLVWATDGSMVYGLDPTDLSVHKTGKLSSNVAGLWFGNGSLWAASRAYGGGVDRVDPATASVAAHVTSDALQIAFSAHGVWLSAAAGPIEIDPTTAVVLATLPQSDVLGQDAAGIAVAESDVWVVYNDSGQLQRIQVP